MSSKIHLNQAIGSHLIEIKAHEKPDKEILIFEKGEHGEDILTYKDIYEASNKVARMFLDNGLEKGDAYANFIPSFLQLVDEVPKTISEKFISRVLKADFSKDSDNVYSFIDYKG